MTRLYGHILPLARRDAVARVDALLAAPEPPSEPGGYTGRLHGAEALPALGAKTAS